MGTRRLGGANLTMLSFLYAFNRCNRAHPMPNQLEAFKIAERANIDGRQLLLTMLIAIAIGTLISFWAHLDILYRYGATSIYRPNGHQLGRHQLPIRLLRTQKCIDKWRAPIDYHSEA
ncbi:TPA: hypothetical protein EYP66_00705 [Candidatus Poribacteria bacterium]|nr:hypothetical protein [Candidatus Poribacteria bacterium]